MEKTVKKYYESAYTVDFAATVLAWEQVDGKWRVLLDVTCFYPGGGGQPCDTGVLGGAQVTECYERDGYIWHILEGSVPKFDIGDEIVGKIDFARRFALMQNHTGEHLLSGLAKRGHGATNVGFHMSERGFTMDLDVYLDDQRLEKLELLANEAVLAAVDVKISTVRGDGPLVREARSKKDFGATDEVRLVDIAGYDLCACAALHVANTQEVGLVKIVAAQKYKGGVRLTVYCGNDAHWDYGRKNDMLREISRLTSSEVQNCVSAVKSLQQVNIDFKKEADGLRMQIFEIKAAQVPENSALAWFRYDGLQPKDMQRFAGLAAQRAKLAVVLSDKKYFVCAQGDADLLRDFVGRFNEELGGKGGISNLVAQGIVTAELSKVEEFLRNEIHR